MSRLKNLTIPFLGKLTVIVHQKFHIIITYDHHCFKFQSDHENT